MEIVDLVVEYPSGLSISDRATYIADLEIVHPSTRVAAILRDLGDTEAPPTAFASIDGVEVELEPRLDGTFAVAGEMPEAEPKRGSFIAKHVGHAWTKDQRQQCGRYLHTLSAASGVGAIGFWHATHEWTPLAIFDAAVLLLFFVLLFIAGMDSMNGE